MKNLIAQNITETTQQIKNKGEYIMNTLPTQIGNVAIYSSDSMYLPIRRGLFREIYFSDIPVGAECPIYDSITDNCITLNGFRISMKREYESRVVIGCVECPEYLVAEDEELDNLFCNEFIQKFLFLLNSKFAATSKIAA